MKRVEVLLVEDDDQDAYITSLALANSLSDFQVTRARNGQEAIDLLASGQIIPDLAVVDLNMPVLDGHELLSYIGARSQGRFPVVVLSTSAEWESQASSLLRGAARFIRKSDNVSGIGRELKAVLDEVVLNDWLQTSMNGDAGGAGLFSFELQAHKEMLVR